MVADRFLDWDFMVVSLGFCRLAMGTFQVLGIRLALAMVVLDSNALVYTLASDCLAVVACLVAVVDLGLVGFPMGFLAVLVDYLVQGIDYLGLE